MKKLLLSLVIFGVIFSNINSQIKINSSGYVTIGGTESSSYPLYIKTGSYNSGSVGLRFNAYYSNVTIDPVQASTGYLGYNNRWGTIWSQSVYAVNLGNLSDVRYKKNINEIKSPLKNLLKLHGVKFDYNEELINKGINSRNLNGRLNNQIGLLAQDVEKIFPEVVEYDTAHDMYMILYSNLIPVLIEAIKEQQTQIDSLKKINSKPKSTLKSAVVSTQDNQTAINNTANESDTASLDQNSPNPFNQSTQIGYYLPESVKDATLYIYDMNGLQIKAIPIHSKGNGSIKIQGSELNAGMYMYTLIADGQEVDTKRMILTK